MSDQISDMESFTQAVAARDYTRVKRYLRLLDPADVAETLTDYDIVQCIVVFRLIPKVKRPDVFARMDFDRQAAMLDRLPDIVVIGLLNDLEPVDRTRLLETLPEGLSARLLNMLSPHERQITDLIMSYPEGSVGRLMTPEFIVLSPSISASEGLDQVRWTASQFPENLIYYVYAVDKNGVYLGQLSIASLIVADPPRIRVGELMDSTMPALLVTDPEEVAVDYFRKYDRHIMPVIDGEGILVGVVESDDVFDVAEEEATEDIQQFGGHGPLEDSYFQTPVWDLIKKRAGWLAVLFVGMMFTVNALEHFDAQIRAWSFLVVFMPMVISSGGNSGSQAASLMIRGLAVKEVDLKDWALVFRREVLIGLSLGLILGTLGFIRVYIGGGHLDAGIIVSLSLLWIVLFGALVGSMLPFVLKLIKLDPAVSSSPVIASLVDIVGIVTFFNIAIWVMSFGDFF